MKKRVRFQVAMCLILLFVLLPAGTAAQSFADPAFESVWQRTDKPIADGRVARSWMWGTKPLTEALTEPYAESPGAMRTVQYFDKARMEINNPNGDRSSQWFVTNGLLVREMVDGHFQIGDASFQPNSPAQETVAGDSATVNANCPTYGSYTYLTWTRADKKMGQKVTATLAKDGTVGDDPSKGSYAGTEIAYFDETNGHNIPKVLWNMMNQSGLIYVNGRYTTGKVVDWLFAMGYPISEPYWVNCKVAGVDQDILVQLFERRVLTYTPANPVGWQVEMGNVGLHYYTWRYGGGAPPPPPPPPPPPQPTQPPSEGCEGIPASTNGTSIPDCGTLDSVFLVSAWGFDPGEEIGFWVNDLNGPIAGTATTFYVNQQGTFTGFFRPGDVFITQPGLYAWVFQGVHTTHQSIVYFKITP